VRSQEPAEIHSGAAAPNGASHAARSAGLDIVRSIAILLVLVSHYGTYFTAWCGIGFPFQLAALGSYGVELFFVLSGFLIGRLLIDILDRGADARAWLIFMVRRWMRTLPLYYVCVLILAFAWPPQIWVPGHAALWRDLPGILTLTQNLAWKMHDGWFGVSWSLTVEEWFYLLFSALLFAAAAGLGRRLGFWCACFLFLLVPPALRWFVADSGQFAEVTSKAVIYRLDAIAFGVVVAWLQVRRAALMRAPRLLLAAGIAVVFLLWGGALDQLAQPSLRTHQTFIFDVQSFGMCLCLPAASSFRERCPAWLALGARVLSHQSYAIYLIHLSLIEFIDAWRKPLELTAPAAIFVTVMALFGLSTLSFHTLERPLLRLRPRQQK